jgi:tRNA-uridine 2-sulfurtransferase
MHKAISLISGGLDSLLATKIIMEQGVHVEGINFFTGFTGDHCYCFKKTDKINKDVHNAKLICDQLGIKLHVIDVAEEFKTVFLNPKYGYGANLNPCLDCKLFMIAQAQKWMKQHKFDFLVTGEVLGQRQKSQRKDTLPLASKMTDDLIVRPLSAKLLPETLPEREGWIKRDKLYGFSGRSRKPQINLAHQFGFNNYSQPAGGCVLTDENFCRRLQDLLNCRANKNYSLDDILLLRVGRHFRINNNLKIIIGRNEIENEFIAQYRNKFVLLQVTNIPGALVLLDGNFSSSDLEFAARLAAYFSKARADLATKVKVTIQQLAENKENKSFLDVFPLSTEEISQKWYV